MNIYITDFQSNLKRAWKGFGEDGEEKRKELVKGKGERKEEEEEEKEEAEVEEAEEDEEGNSTETNNRKSSCFSENVSNFLTILIIQAFGAR